MAIEDLHEICASIALRGKALDPQGQPLSSQEKNAIMKHCREQICNADKSYFEKLFFNEVYDILFHEGKVSERVKRSTKASPST